MSGNGLLQALVFGRLAGVEAAKITRIEAKAVVKEFSYDTKPSEGSEMEEPAENLIYKDGIYEGVGKGLYGPIKLKVTVAEKNNYYRSP